MDVERSKQLQALHLLLVAARRLAGDGGNRALFNLLDGMEQLPFLIATKQEAAFLQQVRELTAKYKCGAATQILVDPGFPSTRPTRAPDGPDQQQQG